MDRNANVIFWKEFVFRSKTGERKWSNGDKNKKK